MTVDLQSIVSLLGLGVLLPLAIAAPLAWPFWRKRRVMLGNILGSGIVALAIVVLIWREYGVLTDWQTQCGNASGCLRDFDSVYTPFLLLVVLGWLDAFILLVLSGIVEDRAKKTWIRPEQF